MGRHDPGFRVIDGGIVGYSDRDVQHQLSEMSPCVTTERSSLQVRDSVAGALGAQTVGDAGDAEHSGGGDAITDGEATPPAKKGQFVGVFHELTYQWAARRRLATKQPI